MNIRYNADCGGGSVLEGFYDRPDAPAPGAIPSSFSQRDFLDGLFPPSAFPRRGPGANGSLRRHTFRGPRQFTVDLAVSRSFRVRESVELQLRAEAYNSFNTVNLYLANSDLALALRPDRTFSTTSSFGKSTAAFDPRMMQMSVGFTF